MQFSIHISWLSPTLPPPWKIIFIPLYYSPPWRENLNPPLPQNLTSPTCAFEAVGPHLSASDPGRPRFQLTINVSGHAGGTAGGKLYEMYDGEGSDRNRLNLSTIETVPPPHQRPVVPKRKGQRSLKDRKIATTTATTTTQSPITRNEFHKDRCNTTLLNSLTLL